ncbi:MAG: TonB-dependent receptor [Chitinophagales bacterium]|nr:TonB-dependent receptor [Chitinophagales bacterium]
MQRIFLFLFLSVPVLAFAQLNTLTGSIFDEVKGKPAANTTFKLSKADTAFTYTTNAEGNFTVEVPSGIYVLDVVIGETTYRLGGYNITDVVVNIGTVYVNTEIDSDERMNLDNAPTLSISETDLREGSGQVVSSALNASRDAFLSTASFVFSNARFRIRGYDFENFTTYMNGLPVNDLEDGGVFWGQWGGLNNVMWNRDNSIGLQPTTYTFGGVGGAYSIDCRASAQRKQLQASYAATNRTFRNRLMLTYSTGLLKKGWAVSVSASRRWASEAYVPGTFYDGYSYFLSVEKLIGNNHSLALTAFGASVRNGRSAASVQEMYDIAGTNYYNPNWGYLNGRKRNAVVGNTHQPMFIFTHEWDINGKSNLLTSAGFTFGKSGRTALDWNNAPDPRPDYYRYLPSFIEDSTLQAVAEKNLRDNEYIRQIRWDRLYEANAMSWETIDSVNGIPGNTVTGKRARYIIENRVQDIKRFNLASTYNNTVNDHVAVTAGINYQMQLSRNYKTVEDLLGADFYVDVNQFAERDFRDSFSFYQNDVNHPNRILKTGDKFGYDYVMNIHKAMAWGQGNFKFNHIDFFVAAELSFTSFWRDGKTRVGLFPDNSYGKSAVQNFFNYAFKGGLTYKIDGRNYLFANGAYVSRAPYFEAAFISPRTRNQVVNNLKSETIYSAELGYIFRSPRVKLKANLFFSQFNDGTRTMSYYHDDFRTLVNYTLTNIDTRHLGAEIGAEAKVYKGFSASAVASFGRYTYISRPDATITQDNNQTTVNNETVYAKNFNVAGTPQLALSLGINYRDPKFWFFNIYFNYYDWMWLDFNPSRRTEGAVDLVDPESPQFASIINQQRLKGQFTMDIFAGYSWLLNNQFKDLKKRHFLIFNVGISNVTNNRNFVTGGFEQLRFDYFDKDVNKFAPKYYYGFGATYFISVAYRMQ